jgi:hypothetical protein
MPRLVLGTVLVAGRFVKVSGRHDEDRDPSA